MNCNLAVILFGSLILIVFNGSAFGGIYNVSYQAIAQCDEYKTTVGYSYRKFFRIDQMRAKVQPDELLNLVVYVLAEKDAHILLTPKIEPAADDPVYEIVIGAGNNEFSQIRRSRKGTALMSTIRSKVLSLLEITPLSIRQSRDGVLQVFILGQEAPLLNYKDPAPLAIEYLSFSTWGAALSKWFFNCTTPNSETDATVTEIPSAGDQRTMKTASERVRELVNRPDYMFPLPALQTVRLQVEILRFMFDRASSVLQTEASIEMTWTDERAQWNASAYENVQAIVIEDKFVSWYPQLAVLNSKSQGGQSSPVHSTVKAFANGTVSMMIPLVITRTWCVEDYVSDSWPNDQLKCEIHIGLTYPSLRLELTLAQDRADLAAVNSIEWNLRSIVHANSKLKSPTKNGLFDDGLQLNESRNKMIAIVLSRNTTFYHRIFNVPLICALILIGITFFMKSFLRAGVCMLSVVLLMGTLMTMGSYAPLSYVPRIMHYYEVSLFISWAALVTFIVHTWLNKYPPNAGIAWLQKPFSNSTMKTIFHLKSSSSLYSNIMDQSYLWSDLSQVIDRFMFVMTLLYLICITINGF